MTLSFGSSPNTSSNGMLLSLSSSRKFQAKAAVEDGGNVFVDMECAKKQAGKQREKKISQEE